MVRIRRVSVEGFRSFPERNSTPTLPERGLVCIRGKNLDTGGSSGSGKSGILYAITYAFGICPYPATELQSNYTGTPMQVELELDTDEGPVVLCRGKKNSLTVGEKTITSAAAISERITKILGINKDFLSALTFRQQKEPGFFLKMGDTDKKEFLSQLLGLEEIESEIARANKLVSEAEEKLLKANSSVETLRPLVVEPAKPEIVTDELVRDQLTDVRKVLEATEQEYRCWEKLLADATTRHNNERAALRDLFKIELDDLTTRHAAIRRMRVAPDISVKSSAEIELEGFAKECAARITAEKTRLDAVRSEINSQLSKLYSDREGLNVRGTHLISLEPEYKALAQQIAKAKANTCPTCGQTWIAALSKLPEWEKRYREVGQMIESCLRAKTDAKAIEPQIEELKNKLATISSSALEDLQVASKNIAAELASERQKRMAVLEVWKAQTVAADAKLNSEVSALQAAQREKLAKLIEAFDAATVNDRVHRDEAKNKVDEFRADELNISAKIDLIKRQNELRSDSYQTDLARYKSLSDQLKTLIVEVENRKAEVAKQTDYVLSLKSFLGSIFDEVLQEISVETNNLLKQVPNVATTTVMFTSEKITQKGTSKQEIRPVIVKNGRTTPLKAGLSGGQFTSVDLAVDLAVGTVIYRRSGRTPGWLILDESFEGHDVPVKEACLTMLRNAAKDRLILIVDHATEIKEMFDAFVDVVSQNDVSRIIAG